MSGAPREHEQLVQLVDCIDRVLPFYADTEDVARWLKSPHPDLGGTAPLDAIEAGRYDEVNAILDRLESGAYL